MHWDCTDVCRIAIGCTEMEIQIINQIPVYLPAINPFLSDQLRQDDF